jgi:hypothetical protein
MLHPQEVMLCPQTVALHSEALHPQLRRALSSRACRANRGATAVRHAPWRGGPPRRPGGPAGQGGCPGVSFEVCPLQPGVCAHSLRMLVSGLTLPAAQALVFCNNRGWMEALAERLTALGFPAAFTCGATLLRLCCVPADDSGPPLSRHAPSAPPNGHCGSGACVSEAGSATPPSRHDVLSHRRASSSSASCCQPT